MNKRPMLCQLLLVFSLFFIAAGSAVNGSENLLTNGDFEAEPELAGWKEDYWQPGSTFVLTGEKVHGGKKALMIRSTTSNDVRAIQTVEVKPNTFYRLAGWIATTDVPEERVGGNLCLMGGYDHTSSVNGTKDWTYVELNFRTHASQTEVTVGARLGMYSNDTTGTAYFDDLSLVRLDTAPASYIQLSAPDAGSATTTGGKGNYGAFLWIALILVFIGVNIYFYRKRSRAGTARADREQEEESGEGEGGP